MLKKIISVYALSIAVISFANAQGFVYTTLEQFGVGNNLSTLQSGNNLNLGVTQNGGASSTIIQTNFFTIGN